MMAISYLLRGKKEKEKKKTELDSLIMKLAIWAQEHLLAQL